MAQETNIQITKQLFVAAQNGDDQAFSELFRLSFTKQYHYACMIMNDTYLAEDIVQDVYISLYKNIKKISDPDKFEPYLSRMTFNQCMMLKRKSFYKSESCVDDEFLMDYREDTPDLLPESSIINGELSNALAMALKTLTDEECYAFLMHFYEDKSVRIISEDMNLSESTVKRRIGEARKKMAAYLTEKDMRSIFAWPFITLSPSCQKILFEDILKKSKEETPVEDKKSSNFKKIGLGIAGFLVALLLLLTPAIFLNIQSTQNFDTITSATPHSSGDVTPPNIVSITNDSTILTIVLDDSSDIDYSQVYLIFSDGSNSFPLSVDTASGSVNFLIPKTAVTLHLADSCGNKGTAWVNIN